MKTLAELQSSDYHQELAHKLWAAFVAQRQGISMNMASSQTVDGCRTRLWAHASREGSGTPPIRTILVRIAGHPAVEAG